VIVGIRLRKGVAVAGRHHATERSGSGAFGPALRGLLGLAVLGAVGLAAAVAVLPAAVGGSALTVLSPSMRPTVDPGDVVVIRPRPVESVAVGDVITFLDREAQTDATRLVTHRVVAVEPGPVFRTRGDANPDPDPGPVAAADVRGVLWYSVPWVGGLAAKAMTRGGAVVGVGLVALVVGGLLLRRRS
jgi:signal peptidase